ncbi:hypothetical protein [Candidatus Lokiarchaeum ossiferum]|uniref:hypothetical protein n=1 Tax=Candidatus Lokiarchaeum ossiferum TaxID=2951803 RepID=UPI00352EB389
MEKRIFASNNLWIIPSWGKVLGYPILGMYKNHKITDIRADSVVFLSSMECTIKNASETTHYIFGIGYYYVKFQIDQGKYIIDKRPLTALQIPDFLAQFLNKSKDITFMEGSDMILKELIYKIPLSLYQKSETQKSFLKGTLNREIFVPYKETIVDFVNYIQHNIDIDYPIIHHRILSADKRHFNHILISNQLQDKFKEEYLESTAGLNGISTEAKEVLEKDFSFMELAYIEKLLKRQEQVFAKIQFDPMYPFSLIENSDILLSQMKQSDPIIPAGISLITPLEIQKGLIQTAFTFSLDAPWPEEFPRKTLEIWGISKEKSIPKIALTEKKSTDLSPEYQKILSTYKQGPTESNSTFQFGFQKNPRVQQRILPPMPQDSIKAMLRYLERLIIEDYEMIEIGNAFSEVRDKIKDLKLHTDYIWNMSKIANILQKEKFGFGLNPRDKEKYLEDVHSWIQAIETEEQKEQERLEQIQREKEQIELEKQREIQLERERIEQQHQEHMRLERERLKQEKQKEQEEIAKEQRKQETIDQKHMKQQQLLETIPIIKPEFESLDKSPEIPISTKKEKEEQQIQKSPLDKYNELVMKFTEITNNINTLKKQKGKSKEEKKEIKTRLKSWKLELKLLKKEIKQKKKALKKQKLI